MLVHAQSFSNVIPANGRADRLRLACDVQWLCQRLRESLPEFGGQGQLASLAVERVHAHSDGTSILSLDASFEGDSPEARMRLFGVLPTNGGYANYLSSVQSLSKHRRGQLAVDDRSRFIGYLDDIDMIVRFEGLDEKLDGLKYLYRPELIAEVGTARQHLGEDCQEIETCLLAHRLHRRAVLQASRRDDPSSAVVLKFYKNGSARPQRIHEVMKFLHRTSFAGDAPVTLPAPLEVLNGCSGLIMEHVTGTPVSELDAAGHLQAMDVAGQALGQLHRLPLNLPTSFGSRQELELLGHWITLVCDVYPHQKGAFRDRFKSVAEKLASTSAGRQVPLHRDFHEGQVLVSPGGGRLVDFDTLSNGDPAIDLGNFIAHLQLRQLQRACDADACTQRFMSSYELSVEHHAPEHIETYRSSTMLRLAAIYSFSSYWQHLVPELLARVD